MKSRGIIRATAASFVVATCSMSISAQAAVLQVSAGELTGALGVNVNGTFYDVEFVEGTCAALFSGCDSPDDFTFTTAPAAELASQALLDQVVLDGPAGNFDSIPALTLGCEASTCSVRTPYSDFVGFVGLYQYGAAVNTGSADVAGIGFSGITNDSTVEPGIVFAIWSPAAAVPEPGMLSLLTLGLMGVGWSRRAGGCGKPVVRTLSAPASRTVKR